MTSTLEGSSRVRVTPGRPLPFGATLDEDGCNFSIYAPNATGVDLLLFDDHDDPQPVAVIALVPDLHKTFQMWHCHVEGVAAGTFYAYRVDGPGATEEGFRFDRDKVLIDPYTRGITKTLWRRGDACGPGDNLATSLRCVVIDTASYDWEGDKPLNRPMNETIIYEMHVGGFTRGVGRGRRSSRYIFRGRREDPLPQEPRRHRGRAIAAVRVRRHRGPCRERQSSPQLLGLFDDGVLRAALGLLRRSRERQPRPRVPQHGQGPAPRGHRGDPRRGVQPHG